VSAVLHVISLGAGVQSSTMALMFARGELTPMPDCAIFADTQGEPRAVYDWLGWLETQLPFHVWRVTAGSLKAEVLEDKTPEARYLLPTYTADGSLGKRQCTRKYKLRPIRRKVAELAADRSVRQYIGISLDEEWRMKPSGVQYVENAYPLVERSMTRGHCAEWLWARYRRIAPRSACTFCPFLDDAQLLALAPDELASAIELDEFVRDRGASPGVRQFLHRSRRPLRAVDLTMQSKQTDMFINECEGMCGV
jgi:hypothetical protein